MVVKFQCPGCEWLEVDDEDIGHTVICPFCKRELWIDPQLAGRRVPETATQSEAPAMLPFDSSAALQEPTSQATEADAPRIHRRSNPKIEVPDVEAPQKKPSPIGLDEPTLYHIRCKCGFMMEVPLEMLGTEAMCPECEHPQRLDLRRTVEQQRKTEFESIQEQNRLGKFWLNTAIVIATLVVVGIILLTVISLSD